MFFAPESRHAQFRTNYLGKDTRRIRPNPSRTYIENHWCQIIILDVDFSQITVCNLQLKHAMYNERCSPHLRLVSVISIIKSADRSARIHFSCFQEVMHKPRSTLNLPPGSPATRKIRWFASSPPFQTWCITYNNPNAQHPLAQVSSWLYFCPYEKNYNPWNYVSAGTQHFLIYKHWPS